GKNPTGWVRPDKLLAYFSHWESLAAASESLSVRLRGCEPHGVPFTCPIGVGDTLSWGFDPPRSTVLPWQGASWRRWLTDKIGSALVAQAGKSHGQIPALVMRRLRADGINTSNWTASGLAAGY